MKLNQRQSDMATYRELFTEPDGTKELTNAQQRIINKIRKTVSPFAHADSIPWISKEAMMDYATIGEVVELWQAGAINNYKGMFYILAPSKTIDEAATEIQARAAYDFARQETIAAHDELSQAASNAGTIYFAKTLRSSADAYHTALEREARAARILIDLL